MIWLLCLIVLLLWINVGVTIDLAVSNIIGTRTSKKSMYLAAACGPLLLLVAWAI